MLMLFKLLIAGGTFGSGSLEPKYKIDFHSEDSPFHPVSSMASMCWSTLQYGIDACLICLDASNLIFP